VRYEILGPLRVIDDGDSMFIGAKKVEILLAALLIRADQVVSAEQLITELWGERLPLRATAGVYVYISELRKFLSRSGRISGRPEGPVVTRPSGYMLRLGTDEFDCQVFRDLMDLGRRHARNHCDDEAAECFEAALGQWRGPLTMELGTGPIVRGFVTWLSEERMECTELLMDTRLRLGCHRELVGRLYSLAAEYPLRESFYRQLMLALYRCERRADALTVYQSARRVLNDELGLEPGRALQDTQRAILIGDDSVDPAYSLSGSRS
jgi:DNA-binding SARP family transcriptional activator